MMIFVVVGLGSMGRRRIRLLKQISDKYEIVGVDSRKERCVQAENELAIKTMDNLTDALDMYNPDGVIVSTSPLSHGKIINECLMSGCNVFTEINLVKDMYDSNISLAKEKDKILFLSSTFLYREEIDYIDKKIKQTEGFLNYNYHVGQYLSDWHPWESINEYFVGDKKTNGCRELFAIEFPWLIKAFGEIDTFEVLAGKNTNLPIQYCDNYIILISHKTGHKGVFAVDVVSRKAVRNLEIYGENLYMTWNGSPYGLKLYDFDEKEEKNIYLYDEVDKRQEYASFVIENAYKHELETFIALINGQGEAKYSFEEDYEVLTLIDSIEAG